MHRAAYLREDRVDAMFSEYLDKHEHDTVTAQSLKAHGLDDEAVADVFAAAKVAPDRGITKREFERLLRLGVHGASMGAESTRARSLLGSTFAKSPMESIDVADLLKESLGGATFMDVFSSGTNKPMDVEKKPATRSKPPQKVKSAAPPPPPLAQQLDELNISATGVKVLAPRTRQKKRAGNSFTARSPCR